MEIEDQPWCPSAVRDGGTDWLRFAATVSGAFRPIAPKLRAVLDRVGSAEVVDLCSGAGGPWLSIQEELARTGPLDVLLTDFYPNRRAFELARVRSGGRLRAHAAPVDATDVPDELSGVRTVFNAFHHFRPDAARAILADAVLERRAIVVCEGSDRRLLGVLGVWATLPAVILCAPFIRPLRVSRLLLTWALPAIPLLHLWDGTVSMLRIYSPEELRELVAGVPGHETFDWDIGTLPIPRSPIGMTYLVGAPR